MGWTLALMKKSLHLKFIVSNTMRRVVRIRKLELGSRELSGTVQRFNNRAASRRTRSKSERVALGTGCRTRDRIAPKHFAAVRTSLRVVLLLELLVVLL